MDTTYNRRTHELQTETRRDKARFATGFVTMLIFVFGFLALGLATWDVLK